MQESVNLSEPLLSVRPGRDRFQAGTSSNLTSAQRLKNMRPGFCWCVRFQEFSAGQGLGPAPELGKDEHSHIPDLACPGGSAGLGAEQAGPCGVGRMPLESGIPELHRHRTAQFEVARVPVRVESRWRTGGHPRHQTLGFEQGRTQSDLWSGHLVGRTSWGGRPQGPHCSIAGSNAA